MRSESWSGRCATDSGWRRTQVSCSCKSAASDIEHSPRLTAPTTMRHCFPPPGVRVGCRSPRRSLPYNHHSGRFSPPSTHTCFYAPYLICTFKGYWQFCAIWDAWEFELEQCILAHMPKCVQMNKKGDFFRRILLITSNILQKFGFENIVITTQFTKMKFTIINEMKKMCKLRCNEKNNII